MKEETLLRAFSQSPVVMVELPGDRTRYLVAHESAKRKGYWQVSAFYADGPYTDVSAPTREGAIRESLETIKWPGDPNLVRPMDPAEFDALTQTEEWKQGIMRLRLMTLDNLIRCRYGHDDEVMSIRDDAYEQGRDYGPEAAIKVYEAGLRMLRKRRVK